MHVCLPTCACSFSIVFENAYAHARLAYAFSIALKTRMPMPFWHTRFQSRIIRVDMCFHRKSIPTVMCACTSLLYSIFIAFYCLFGTCTMTNKLMQSSSSCCCYVVYGVCNIPTVVTISPLSLLSQSCIAELCVSVNFSHIYCSATTCK